MRALQEKICHFRAGDEEEIKQVLSLSPDVYILLLYNSVRQLWALIEHRDGQERGRLILKNLKSGATDKVSNRPVVLFAFNALSFGILAGEEIHIWKTFKSKPGKERIMMNSHNEKVFFDSNPVTFIRSMPNGSLVMAHKTVFSEAYFFSIALKRLEGYSFSTQARPLESDDYRHLSYIAASPCIMDLIPYGEDFFIYTPGSFRDWQKYAAETSILVKMNQMGQVLHSREIAKGRGVFSQYGNCLMLKPFGSDRLLYFYNLNENQSVFFSLDENTRWTPGTADTRFLVTGKRIAAWDEKSFILSALHNMPDWCTGILSQSKSVG